MILGLGHSLQNDGFLEKPVFVSILVLFSLLSHSIQEGFLLNRLYEIDLELHLLGYKNSLSWF